MGMSAFYGETDEAESLRAIANQWQRMNDEVPAAVGDRYDPAGMRSVNR